MHGSHFVIHSKYFFGSDELIIMHVSTVDQISQDVCRLACVETVSDRVIERKLIGSCVTVLYLKVIKSSVKVKISCTSEHNIAV